MKQKGPSRKIAITVWAQRISPVFDSARTLLIAEIDGETLVNTSYLSFDPELPLELLRLLHTQKVMTIICGAVSEGLAGILEAAGFTLIPFIAGEVRQILEIFIHGDSLGGAFKMPGCGKNICCRGKIRRGRDICNLDGNRPHERGSGRRNLTAAAKICVVNEGSEPFAEMSVGQSGNPEHCRKNS